MTSRARVAYLVAFGAPPVQQLDQCVELLRQENWDTHIVLSPTAAEWVEPGKLATLSNHPIWLRQRMPWQPDPLPPADLALAAPITFNSICKWALGINDNIALGILNEELASPTSSITAAPCVNNALRKHPAYKSSISTLEQSRVHFLDSTITRSSPGSLAQLDWDAVVTAAIAQHANRHDE